MGAILLLAWLVVPWWLILGTTLAGEVVFAVCVLFTLIAFGIAGITALQALRSWIGHRGGAELAAERKARVPMDTHTGHMSMTAAAIQILLIPGSVAVGFTAFAIVELITGV